VEEEDDDGVRGIRFTAGSCRYERCCLEEGESVVDDEVFVAVLALCVWGRYTE